MLRPAPAQPTPRQPAHRRAKALSKPQPTRLERLLAFLEREARSDMAYLVPLRLFVGVGWLRALAEKLSDPQWHGGAALATFLKKHLEAGEVVFPFYAHLIQHTFIPNAGTLAVIVMLGQLLVGVSLLTGTLTRVGLLGGLFMNLNFIAAGAPSPSAFYVVMQLMLLATNAGAVLGVDRQLETQKGMLGRISRARVSHLPRDVLLMLALASLGVGLASLLNIRDFSPKGSIEDPAAIFTVMSCIWAAHLGIAWLRTDRNMRATSIQRG